ncbi:hypothetical protein D3C73_1343730 [compost metagenome]
MKVESKEYDMLYANDKKLSMQQEYDKINDIIDAIVSLMKKMDNAVKAQDRKHLIKAFPKFDKLFKSIYNNDFYKIYVVPMIRSHYYIFNTALVGIRGINDPLEKAIKILDVFGKYLYQCQYIVLGSNDLVRQVHEAIEQQAQKREVHS